MVMCSSLHEIILSWVERPFWFFWGMQSAAHFYSIILGFDYMSTKFNTWLNFVSLAKIGGYFFHKYIPTQEYLGNEQCNFFQYIIFRKIFCFIFFGQYNSGIFSTIGTAKWISDRSIFSLIFPKQYVSLFDYSRVLSEFRPRSCSTNQNKKWSKNVKFRYCKIEPKPF